MYTFLFLLKFGPFKICAVFIFVVYFQINKIKGKNQTIVMTVCTLMILYSYFFSERTYGDVYF